MIADDELIRLRAENQHLKEQLQQRDQHLLELEQLVLSLQEQVKTLQERLAKDSHNSHLPPSSDRFARQKKTRSQRKRSGKKPGGQPGHDGHYLALSLTPDEVIVHEVETCGQCQADLRDVKSHRLERRQVVDVPPARLHITEHQAERKCCPHCHVETRAAFPELVSAPVQYGSGIAALAVYLVTQHLLPSKRAAEILSDLMGVRMSEGSIRHLCQRCANVLRPVERQIKIALRQAPVIHQDESGLYVEGKRAWMHVTSTSKLTHYQVHPKRGTDALDANGILPGYQGTSVHDGWAAYEGYGCNHALCNVHLLRELIFLEETTSQPWTRRMQRLLLALKRLTEWVKARGQTALSEQLQAKVVSRYRQVLALGEQANPPPARAENEPHRRGRRKQSAARNLLDRLTKHEDAVLAFVRDLRVPFDNSQAERDIRMLKVQQKISGCFRSFDGAREFCRIRGYLSTLHKQGRSLLSALQLALSGHPLLPALTSGPE
jgi:transposase